MTHTARTSTLSFAAALLGTLALPATAVLAQSQTTAPTTHSQETTMTFEDKIAARSQPFAVRVDFTIDPERADAFEAATTRLARHTIGRDKPIFYRVFRNAETPGHYTLFGEWEDGAQWTRFSERPYHIAFNETVGPMIESATRRLYRPVTETVPDEGEIDMAEVERQEPAAPTASQTRDRLAAAGLAGQPFVLFVDVPVAEDGVATVKHVTASVEERTLTEEPVIKYGYYQNTDDPTDILLFEWWTNFDGMDAHLAYPQFTDLMRVFAAFGGDGREVGIYDPVEQ